MEFETVGIVGTGIMGAGIAETAIEAGYRVMLRSRQIASAQSMMDSVRRSFGKKVEHGKKTSQEAEEGLSRLNATSDLRDLAKCDLIIESVIEDMAVKLHLFKELDQLCDAKTILATNTSTLPVVELAAVTNRPDKVCGIHFFNPAPLMKLVEIVRPLTVSQETIDKAIAFALSCGKDPVEVKDQAGFVVNALLFPYLNNAIRLLEQGIATRDGIDRAMKGGCGFPMGPFALLDLVGLDTSLSILNSLYEEFKDPNYAPAPMLKRMVAAKMYGRKNKVGFYNY